MTKHEFHNTLRKIFNIEWSQLSFLTESQKDNFFSDPPRFFIAADDETADKIWALLFPRGPVSSSQVVRFPGGQPYETRNPIVNFEYDTGRPFPPLKFAASASVTTGTDGPFAARAG